MKEISTICIIDDDAVYQFAIKRAIRNYNNQVVVTSFTNAEEAIATFKSILASGGRLADIILVDINMPIMDGWQFLDDFAAVKPLITEMPDIYMASSSLDISDISRAESHPDVKGFLLKPLDISNLFVNYIVPG